MDHANNNEAAQVHVDMFGRIFAQNRPHVLWEACGMRLGPLVHAYQNPKPGQNAFSCLGVRGPGLRPESFNNLMLRL